MITGTTLWKEELPVGIARAMRFIASGIEQSEKHKQLNTWVMGWQCHFEVTPKSMVDMVAEGGDYIRESITHHPDSVQTAKQILALGEQYIEDNNAWLSLMLNNMANLNS